MKILVYGSLREDEYNFDRIKEAFGDESIKKVGETEVAGYKMHNLGSYPGINKGTQEDKIVCDILEVNDEAARFIERMELGAGYAQEEAQGLPIYVMRSSVAHYPAVSSGNWKKRKGYV